MDVRKAGSNRLPRVILLSALFLALILPAFKFAQSAARPDDEPKPGDYRISVNVGMVVLPVVVTNNKGLAVSGLAENSFQVYDDGHPQQISLFESEDVPITVGLVVDNSGSMAARRPEVLAAGEAFARSSNPQDQMFVVNFNQRVSMGLPKGVPFTGDVQQLRNALQERPASGNTALYDGVAAALRHVDTGTTSRKALIIISDGGDNASHIGLAEVLRRAQASNVEIYALGVHDDLYEGEDLSALKHFAKATGGKAYFPDTPEEMATICREIAQDLRHQYTIGYHPSNPGSASGYHTIRVTATATGNGRLHVYTRSGYLMSPESVTPDKASL
jgi:Ca-activated chloride channel homolog